MIPNLEKSRIQVFKKSPNTDLENYSFQETYKSRCWRNQEFKFSRNLQIQSWIIHDFENETIKISRIQEFQKTRNEDARHRQIRQQ